MPIRVAFVNDIGGISGIEVMLLLLARCLPRDEFTPVYIGPAPGMMADHMRAAGAEVLIVPRARWWSTSFYIGARKVLNPLAILYDLTVIGRYQWKLTHMLRRARIDVVHSSGMVTQISSGFSARLVGLPHIAHVQDIIGSAWIRWIYARILERLADRIAAISTAVGVPYAPRKRLIIPNVADLDRWQGTAGVRESLGIGADKTLIGMVGRLTRWKGQHVFLTAAGALAEQDSSYRFVLVGDDAVGGVSGYRAELEQMAGQGPLAGRVQFLGRRSDVLDVMAACDVLVHASTKPEPFGIVIVEAMALGKPVIATAMGGPLDIITDQVDGLLVAPNDPAELADAIRFLHDQPDAAQRIGAQARIKSRTQFSAQVMTDRFAALYRELARPGDPA